MKKETETSAAVRKTIVVSCPVEHAFQVWTDQIRSWWPRSHSMSRDPDTQVFLEPRVGGRFYERTPDGQEWDWGVVLQCEPPFYLSHTWYLGSSQELPSRVELQFVPLGQLKTRIEVHHRGPDLIGDLWESRKGIFQSSWDSVTTQFSDFLDEALDQPTYLQHDDP